MPAPRLTKMSLIRHAPAQDGGRLAGRRDVSAHPGDPAQITALRRLLPASIPLIASPAQRCQQTAQMIWDAASPRLEPDLWEQDFGTWEGTAYDALPDIGPLNTADLAAYRPPQGESFVDLSARIAARLNELRTEFDGQHMIIMCHAGVIRAALAWAADLGPAALGFAVDPLSLTQLELSESGNRVARVNWTTG